MDMIESTLSTIQVPDAMLPTQYADMGRSSSLSPERRLMLAVLTDAIYCLGLKESIAKSRRALYYDAVEWLNSDDRSELFSFLSLMDVFGFDADHFRREALRAHLNNWGPMRTILGMAA